MVAPFLVVLLLNQQAPDAGAARKKLEVALPAFAATCERDEQDENACYYLARALSALDRWGEACEPFEKALRVASKTGRARVHRAMALNYIALGRPADAERHFRLAVQLNPGPEVLPEDPRTDYGAFLFREGRTDEALRLLEQAVEAMPRSARAHAELGRVLLHLGKVDAAVASLEQAVKLDPRRPSVRLLLGRAYLQLGRTEEGRRELQLAREGLTRDSGSSTVR